MKQPLWTVDGEEENMQAFQDARASQEKVGYSVVTGKSSLRAEHRQVLIFSWGDSTSPSQVSRILCVPENQSCAFGHHAKELYTALW